MREAPLTDSQKTDKGLYGFYAPYVRGREVTAQSKNGLGAKGGGAAMNSTAIELEFTRRRAMRGIVKIFVIAVFAAAILALLAATPSQALKNSPTFGGIDRCMHDAIEGKDAERGCEGLLCWCCYSDGCYICNNLEDPRNAGKADDCTWDPKYAGGRRPGRVGGPGGGVLDPGTQKPGKPPVAKPGGGTLQR